MGSNLPDGWSLGEASKLDQWEFARAYGHSSGGLLVDAFSLGSEGKGHPTLERAYTQPGLIREQKLYSLCWREKLCALLIVNRSNLGFNLSEILNSISVIVTNAEELPWSGLSVAIAHLTSEYPLPRVPVLFYPTSNVESNGIPCEKNYQLWILNVQYGNDYMDYVQEKFRMTYP